MLGLHSAATLPCLALALRPGNTTTTTSPPRTLRLIPRSSPSPPSPPEPYMAAPTTTNDGAQRTSINRTRNCFQACMRVAAPRHDAGVSRRSPVRCVAVYGFALQWPRTAASPPTPRALLAPRISPVTCLVPRTPMPLHGVQSHRGPAGVREAHGVQAPGAVLALSFVFQSDPTPARACAGSTGRRPPCASSPPCTRLSPACTRTRTHTHAGTGAPVPATRHTTRAAGP